MITLAKLRCMIADATRDDLRGNIRQRNGLNLLGRTCEQKTSLSSFDAIRSEKLLIERSGMPQPCATHFRLLREELLHEIFDALHKWPNRSSASKKPCWSVDARTNSRARRRSRSAVRGLVWRPWDSSSPGRRACRACRRRGMGTVRPRSAPVPGRSKVSGPAAVDSFRRAGSHRVAAPGDGRTPLVLSSCGPVVPHLVPIAYFTRMM